MDGWLAFLFSRFVCCSFVFSFAVYLLTDGFISYMLLGSRSSIWCVTKPSMGRFPPL